MMLDLEYISKEVRRIAMDAGAFLRKERSTFDYSKVEKKHAHDYVSYVDKESEKLIVSQLRALLPEAGFEALVLSIENRPCAASLFCEIPWPQGFVIPCAQPPVCGRISNETIFDTG